jgi:hypothetical protein
MSHRSVVGRWPTGWSWDAGNSRFQAPLRATKRLPVQMQDAQEPAHRQARRSSSGKVSLSRKFLDEPRKIHLKRLLRTGLEPETFTGKSLPLPDGTAVCAGAVAPIWPAPGHCGCRPRGPQPAPWTVKHTHTHTAAAVPAGARARMQQPCEVGNLTRNAWGAGAAVVWSAQD